MTARHGLYLLITSKVLQIAGEFFGAMYFSGASFFWGISSALWTVGLLVILVKLLSYGQLKEFLDK